MKTRRNLVIGLFALLGVGSVVYFLFFSSPTRTNPTENFILSAAVQAAMTGANAPDSREKAALDIINVVLAYDEQTKITAHAEAYWIMTAVDDEPYNRWSSVSAAMVSSATRVSRLQPRDKAVSTTVCGKILEAAYQSYIRAKINYFVQWLYWWRKYHTELAKTYAQLGYIKSVDLCIQRNKCVYPPSARTVDLTVITDTACLSEYFSCRIGGQVVNCTPRRIIDWITQHKLAAPHNEMLLIEATGRVYGAHR